ncbi:biotin--[acetyl-CoA-carboxylase] ligase [Nocardioides sp. AX2bis]|uniref:biotin--[acetyl-CoA-carboxylase] ligase n=1 Tax=Nocardioides sp. AX2bis TaxID=2653157 RepID=UPI0012F2E755|nr:biotin--[acetyl-CoA-carboxylase] ligase [Nocardioides sp. AX2bis]VXB07481.1 Biotin-protein ligase [Nocardioides sp. AX2bis]
MTAPPGPRPPLDPDDLAAGLAPLGLRLELVASTASTNALAAERVRAGAAPGLVVVAEEQTGGRGRLDRRWETPPGTAAVYSCLLAPEVPAASWPWLPLLTGLATARTLRRHGVEGGVKWPNDVLVGDRKISGILVERVDGARGPVAVVGVGVNADLREDELPVPTATSVGLVTGRPVDRTALLVDLLTDLVASHDDWLTAGGADRLRAAYARECVTVGRQVRVALPGDRELHGLARTVDEAGRLVVRTDEGQDVVVAAGDVVHVRPRPGSAPPPSGLLG